MSDSESRVASDNELEQDSVVREPNEPVEEHQAGEETTEQTEQTGDNNDDDDDDDADKDFFADKDDGNGGDRILEADDLSKLKVSKRSNAPAVSASPRREKSTEPQGYDQEEEEQQSGEMDETTKRRQELEAKLERALKRPKIKRRRDEHDLTNDEDELIQILKQQMDTAAKKDSELIENNSGIAVNKVQLLPKVRDILSKANLAEVILDNNLLAEVRQWLEPLPDASLPSYEIQKTLFDALLKLPINTNHLRESGIGKILLFYQKSKRVEPKIKRIADKLVSDWTRPIIGASDNYRDKRFQSVEIDSNKLKKKLNRPSRKLTEAEKKKLEAEKSLYEQQAARRNRAAAPAPTVTDYKFAPKSRVNKDAMSIVNAGVGSSLNRDDQFKRIKQKLAGGGRSRTAKKGGISIEGRGLN